MIASILKLNRQDMTALKVTDAYSLHRVVYDLFEDIREESEKSRHTPSGFLYADKGGDFNNRLVLILSDRQPRVPTYGEVETKPVPESFLEHSQYCFEVVVNPTRRDNKSRKLVPIRGVEAVKEWFCERAPQSWGFSVYQPSLQVKKLAVNQFQKKGTKVTIGAASLQGSLSVTDRNLFMQSFCRGIGRGRAFGFGLLQLVPQSNSSNI